MLQDIEPSHLAPADFEGLADATWRLSKLDETIEARQKAFAGYAAEGNDPRAAFMAGRLAVEHFDRGEPAVAMGWLMKAQRHLSDQPESVEHSFLALIQANVARFRGDLDGSADLRRGRGTPARPGGRDGRTGPVLRRSALPVRGELRRAPRRGPGREVHRAAPRRSRGAAEIGRR
jgi:hypothetical protein